ncbi:MAG: C4-dicarboxylate ABC transporter permease [Hyphomicrobiales bacterium]|nr:C4-dicarboxylate ABC transporter permease [Hyphomicrobiales bacterium]MCP5001896.1 C4-dicarboxylate ABC transporter permease [Hyphomicrobiales bacterium]
MKRLASTLLATVVLAGASLTAQAETIDITVAAGHPPVFRWVKHITQTFIPAVNKALEGTDITVNWSEHYGGSLAKVGGVLEAVEEGLAEVGLVSSLFEAAKLSPQNVTYFTPFVSSDATAISDLIDALHEENKELRQSWEENNLEYLGAAIGIDDYLLMTNFPVKTLDDLKGKKIGAPGPAVNWLKGTGAIGVSGNLTTYYNELKTGVYDGVIVFATAALPGKLYEVAPHITRVGFGAQYAGGIAANKDWYDAQPEALQKALKKGGVAQRKAYHTDLDAAISASLDAMRAKGATVTEVSPEFRMKWAAGMENVAKDWAAKLDGEGKPGSKVLETYMNAMRDSGATPVRNWDQE